MRGLPQPLLKEVFLTSVNQRIQHCTSGQSCANATNDKPALIRIDESAYSKLKKTISELHRLKKNPNLYFQQTEDGQQLIDFCNRDLSMCRALGSEDAAKIRISIGIAVDSMKHAKDTVLWEELC